MKEIKHFNPRTLAGCDWINLVDGLPFVLYFQSTHPRGVRLQVLDDDTAVDVIFNPRTPCGVRPVSSKKEMRPAVFQSTHPLRGATSGQLIKIAALHISIHAPLAGCDDNP
ncbi:MAG: hypothetical protein ACLUNQ_05385 [Oscillospiraceae bacterium]